MTHAELVDNLALHFFGMRLVFCECELDSRVLTGGRVGVADVMTFATRYNAPQPTIYECKVSRADFQSDIRSGKWKRYLPYCERFYFAVPRGLIKMDEVPEGAGLYVLGDKGWQSQRRPKINHEWEFDRYTLMALLFRGAYTGGRLSRYNEIADWHETSQIQKLAREIGRKIAKAHGVKLRGRGGWDSGDVLDLRDAIKTLAKAIEGKGGANGD